MDNPRRNRTEWALTGEAFARFLACLDSDAGRAGEKYETIRQKLVKYFDWRGAHFPDECADETINRIIRKLDSGEVLRQIETYCLGVARMVFLETLKQPGRLRVGLEDAPNLVAPGPEEEDEENERQRCFYSCLRELTPESRQLVLRYYQDDRREKIDHRQLIADQLGIPLNALRSRVQRIRDRLERCTEQCLSQKGKK